MNRPYAPIAATTILLVCLGIVTLVINNTTDVAIERLSVQGAHAVVERSCFKRSCFSINGETSCRQSRHNCEPSEGELDNYLSQEHQFFDDGEFPSFRKLAGMDSFEDHDAAVSHLLGINKKLPAAKVEASKQGMLKVVKGKAKHNLQIKGQLVPEQEASPKAQKAAKAFAKTVQEARHQFLKKVLAARAKALKDSGQSDPDGAAPADAQGDAKAGKVQVVHIDPEQLKKMLGADKNLKKLAAAVKAAQKQAARQGAGAKEEDSTGDSVVEKVMAGGPGGTSSDCVEKQCVMTQNGGEKCETAKVPCDTMKGAMKSMMGGKGLGGLMKGIAAAAAAEQAKAGSSAASAPGGFKVIRVTVPGAEGDGEDAPFAPPALTPKQKAEIVSKLKTVAGKIEKKLQAAKKAKKSAAEAKHEKQKQDAEEDAKEAARDATSSSDKAGQKGPEDTKTLQVVRTPHEQSGVADPAAVVSEHDYRGILAKGQKRYKTVVDEAHGKGHK